MTAYINNRVLIFSIILVFNSCSDILEENPKNFVSSKNFYQTEVDAVSAVNAVYAQLNAVSFPRTPGPYFHSYFLIAGLASDELVNIQGGLPAYDQLQSFNHGPVNVLLTEHWASTYRAIFLANTALARIPEIEMDEQLKNRLLREAHFLRGTLYFDLVRMWGSVPLLLNVDEPLKPEPAPVSAIYEQLISDIQEGEGLPETYPDDNGLGRATRYAAKAMLARVYLTLEEWQKSADKAKEVIESGQFELWDDFADVFKVANNDGKEAVFSIGFGDAGGAISFWEPGQFNIRFLPSELRQQIPNVNAVGAQGPTQHLYDSFHPDDERRDVTFLTEVTNAETGEVVQLRPYIQKWWDKEGEPNAGPTSNDFPHIRYSDVLLMYAEAQAELGNFGEANLYLNMVRNRAGLPDVNINNIEEFKAAILQERRWEFVAEGHRWFDLVRTGTLEDLVPLAKPGVVPQPRHYLFPIPQREIDLNQNLEQNPGY